MAFKFFKKKEPEFPAEEKSEILESFEEPKFEEGFRTPEELKPPTIPKPPTELPPFKAPEPIPAPKPEPMGVEIKSEFGPVPRVREAPRIYIRIDKYKEVMETIRKLDDEIQETKEDLEELHSISESEREKIREAAKVLLEIEKLLRYLESTFTAPED